MEPTARKIALFVGSDITAHLVLNKIVPELISSFYEPIIFLPKHRAGAKANLQELRQAAFIERGLPNEVVYPFLEAHPFKGEPKNISPHALAAKYNLQVETVDDVNAPEFVEKIKSDTQIKSGLSIRCFQIFGDNIIGAFHEKDNGYGLFLNLHPGVLPKYRGVLSTARAFAAGEKEYGWTLHHIDRGIDTGDILWVTAKRADITKTGTLAQIDVAGIGADSVLRALNELDQGNVLKGYPQDGRTKNYYTYPDQKELRAWKEKGVRISDLSEISEILVDRFSDASTHHGRMLSAEISKAIETWKQNNEIPMNPEASVLKNAAVGPKPPRTKRALLGGGTSFNFGT